MANLNFLSSLKLTRKFIFHFQKISKLEKPRVFIFRLISYFFYIIEGKFLAFTFGWEKSYVGLGSRIIGSKFIKVYPGTSVGRYSWIEVVISESTDLTDSIIDLGKDFQASEKLHISATNKISFGNNCLVGSNVHVTDHNHGSYKGIYQSFPYEHPIDRKITSHGIVSIGDNVWIGDNVVILGPVVIGAGAVVGANSLVNQDIPASSIAAGIPAKVVKIFNHKSGTWDPVL